MEGNRWAPRQGPIMGRSMMVASAHPTASEAGLSVLRAGGNAVDAAVCVSWLQTVLKPTRTQVGGDLFYLIYSADTGEVTAINGSGAAPSGATPAAYAGGIPERGIRSVTVPGFVDGVLTAHAGFGSRPMAELMAPAIELARDGFPVSVRLSDLIQQFAPLLRQCDATARVFLPGGAVPRPGQVLRQTDLARTLAAIQAGGREAFYGDDFERALVKTCREQGGHFAPGDLAPHRTEVKPPVSAGYRGYTVYEQPPVSQGYILLEELGILEGFDLAGRSPNDPDVIHLMVEAKKLAFADSLRYGGDPERSGFAVDDLLDPEFLARRRAAIDPHRAADAPAAGALAQKVTDTTAFAVVDARGNAVAAIQSVFQPWGSGVVVEGTGVLLNNRLTGFSLEPGHANVLEPGKRPVHTLNQYLVVKDEKVVLVGGTPGGQQQVQTNMQILSAVLDAGYDVQAANDLPRWGHSGGLDLTLESRYDESVYVGLKQRGHHVRRAGAWDGLMGRVTLIGI
ncbi:MAG: gamma-glutamyltransferase, partial [Dehalococcoidia bacterium]